MEIKEIVELMKAVSEYGLTKFDLEQGDTKLVMKREKEMVLCSGLNPSAGEHCAENNAGIAAMQISTEKPEIQMERETKAEAEAEAEGNLILCPLVGTFYSAPSPEAESFVKVGDHVKKGQIVGIVEAMKLMNEIESEFDGVVEAVLVENETVVEYGQPLVKIR